MRSPFFVLNIAQGGNYFLVCLTPNAFPTGGDWYPVIECTRKHAFPFVLLSFTPPSVRCSPFYAQLLLFHKLCTAIVSDCCAFYSVSESWLDNFMHLFCCCHHFDFAGPVGENVAARFARATNMSWTWWVGVFVVASLTKANYYRMTMQKFMIASNNKALHSRSILSGMIFHFFFSKPSPWFFDVCWNVFEATGRSPSERSERQQKFFCYGKSQLDSCLDRKLRRALEGWNYFHVEGFKSIIENDVWQSK